MEILLTGATGYIGHAVAEKLIARGDTVVGLARSDAAADALRGMGVQPVAGDLDRPDELTVMAHAADAVVHLGFQWGSDVRSTIEAERRVVEALMAGVAGRTAPFLFPGGTSVLGDTGDLVFEEDTPIQPHPLGERLGTERHVLEAGDVHGVVIRAPNVYGRDDGQALFAVLRQAGNHCRRSPFRQERAAVSGRSCMSTIWPTSSCLRSTGRAQENCSTPARSRVLGPGTSLPP